MFFHQEAVVLFIFGSGVNVGVISVNYILQIALSINYAFSLPLFANLFDGL